MHGSSRALVLKLTEGLQARRGGAEVDEIPEPGIGGLGTRVGSRTLGELMGNMASAQSLGVQGRQACKNWRCRPPPPQGKKMFLGGGGTPTTGSELRM